MAFSHGLKTSFLARSFTLLSSSSLIYKKNKVVKRKPATICSKNTNWRQNVMTKSDVLWKDTLLYLVWTWINNLSAVERGFYIAVIPSCHNNWPPAGGPNPAQLRKAFSKLRGLVVAVNKFQISLNHCWLTMTRLKAELRIFKMKDTYRTTTGGWTVYYQMCLLTPTSLKSTCTVERKLSFEQKLSGKLLQIVH